MPASSFRVKTVGKTKRDPRDWASEILRYMPMVAPLPSVRVR